MADIRTFKKIEIILFDIFSQIHVFRLYNFLNLRYDYRVFILCVPDWMKEETNQ